MKALLVLGGEAPGAALLRALREKADLLVACDRGLEAVRKAGLSCDLVIGDMDSVDALVLGALPPGTPVRRLPVMKDDTDCVAALREVRTLGVEEVVLTGALGGRIDHALGNLQALFAARQMGMRASIREEGQVILPLLDGEEAVLRGAEGDTVSLLACGQATGVTLTGFCYPLSGGTLTGDLPLGISNVVTGDPATVHLETGRLWLFHLKAQRSPGGRPR